MGHYIQVLATKHFVPIFSQSQEKKEARIKPLTLSNLVTMLKLCCIVILIAAAAAATCQIKGNKVYKHVNTAMTWSAARKHCKSALLFGLGGDLIVDVGSDANAFVDVQINDVWLGGHDETTEGTWVWVNGKSIKSSPQGTGRWAAYDPDDRGGQDCMVGNWKTRGQWDDQACSRKHPFICEYDLSGARVDGRFLKKYSTAMTFVAAKAKCATEKGLLVVANTKAINTYLAGQEKSKGKEIWIGADEMAAEGQWKWSDGSLVWHSTYINWAPGQPDNGKRIEHCASMKGGKWEDKYCEENHPFYCQFPALTEALVC